MNATLSKPNLSTARDLGRLAAWVVIGAIAAKTLDALGLDSMAWALLGALTLWVMERLSVAAENRQRRLARTIPPAGLAPGLEAEELPKPQRVKALRAGELPELPPLPTDSEVLEAIRAARVTPMPTRGRTPSAEERHAELAEERAQQARADQITGRHHRVAS